MKQKTIPSVLNSTPCIDVNHAFTPQLTSHPGSWTFLFLTPLRQVILLTLLLSFFLGLPNLPAQELHLDDLFPTNRVLNVRIKVKEEDWNTLRYQTRSFNDALNPDRRLQHPGTPFTYFTADVTIDGNAFTQVVFRKKGFLVSLNTKRPSLKIKLNHVDTTAELDGLTTLTFNNNQQDVSLISQFLGYRIFNDAGTPAPRCAYANVIVNGKSLGIYSHVETVRETLLRREFGTDKGTLYEGTVVDFEPGWEGSFELKTGKDEPGRKKIRKIIQAVAGDTGTPLWKIPTVSRAIVPTNGEFDRTWMLPEFDDSEWNQGQGGAGYETESGYDQWIHPELDFRESLFHRGTSIYLRIPFTYEMPDSKGNGDSKIQLGVRFDDGFVAYLNGRRIAAFNAPEAPGWDSTATQSCTDSSATTYQSFPIPDPDSLLQEGQNILALHGLNVSNSSSDMLIDGILRTGVQNLESSLADHIDLDSFFRFWALEGLLGFWDGYSGNRNNFFIYHHPDTDKIYFLPWGADAMFTVTSKFERNPHPSKWVKTRGLLASRLYRSENGRKRYAETMIHLLENHWDEDALLAETDRIEAMLKPYTSWSQFRFRWELATAREFIRNRRGDIMKDLKASFSR